MLKNKKRKLSPFLKMNQEKNEKVDKLLKYAEKLKVAHKWHVYKNENDINTLVWRQKSRSN